MMNNSGGGGMSWMEEDAVATASPENGVRGGTVRKRGADEEICDNHNNKFFLDTTRCVRSLIRP